MTREIEFRGKRCADGKWVYGDYVAGDSCDVSFIFPRDITSLFCVGGRYEVDESTVGQFTGLHDKNGVKIFEGDVVVSQFSKKPFGVVTWHIDGYFFFDSSFGEWQYYGNGFTPIGEIMKRKINGKSLQFEVIGNIYDNPELLSTK